MRHGVNKTVECDNSYNPFVVRICASGGGLNRFSDANWGGVYA